MVFQAYQQQYTITVCSIAKVTHIIKIIRIILYTAAAKTVYQRCRHIKLLIMADLIQFLIQFFCLIPGKNSVRILKPAVLLGKSLRIRKRRDTAQKGKEACRKHNGCICFFLFHLPFPPVKFQTSIKSDAGYRLRS